MSHTRNHLHCLRPLSDAPDRPPAQVDTRRPVGAELATGGADPHAGRNGSHQSETADAVSRALVGLLRTRTGSGPIKVKTALSSDLAIVTLEDFLTPAEQTLLNEGRRALASQFRTALHDGMRAEAVTAVEQITGRPVAAYLTAHQHHPELATIAVHLGPSAGVNADR